MIIAAATRMTNAIFPGQQHREMAGAKKLWIRFLRRYPAYYKTLYYAHRQPAENKLVQIHLEPTNGCNLKCVTCNNSHADKDKGKMPLEQACRIIDEAWQELGPEGKLGLFIRGESVIHPKLPEMIAYARKVGFTKILLSTNIMLLSGDRARRILEAGISELRLSVDAVDAETFEKTRAGSQFEIIVQNLEDLHKIRKEMNSPCHFRMHGSLHRSSFEKVPEFIRRWSHMIQQFRFTVAVNQGGLFPQAVAGKFSGMKFATATSYQIPCRILYDYVGVTWNGKMTSCCVDYRERFVVGKIEDGLRAGFMNDNAEAIRQSHLDGKFGDLCGQCGFNNALVDWFEDEINDYVAAHKDDFMNPAHDDDFRKALDRIIAKFDTLADNPPSRKQSFR